MTTASYLGDLRRLAQDATSIAAECEVLHTAILSLRAGRRITVDTHQHLGLRRQISDVAAGRLMPITLVGTALVLMPAGFRLETSDRRAAISRGGQGYASERLWSLALSIADACLWAHVHDLTSGEVRP
ncbi:hypothetical protein [Azospirillum picis]|uniref:Uncharacterized protein n=1 Tax=Azospirillum picis TaxID=488438 RepID=A0ABU0MEF0_9PROT|nr:hypothetical protein [Azospirillum picis]MBP2297972.1 hypothetical protein [Azospirillum picis]MDQ0531810.1 hypothetical protein [Azospirillum picis]